jgi:hypothetical protein
MAGRAIDRITGTKEIWVQESAESDREEGRGLKSTPNILRRKESTHSSGSFFDSMFQNSTQKGADSGSGARIDDDG